MDINDFIPHMDTLYKSALVQARDENLAQELVQETYLHTLEALAKGATIQNPKAYLQSVLRNRFFMHLRQKYKFSTVYIGDLPQELPDAADFGALERSQEAEAIRRELAFLSHTYREVMVRYYMKNQSVAHIAEALSIPKGTVLSRLDTGRKKVKEGFENMENYTENSYEPQVLTLGMNGRTGRKGEPFTCVKSALDQNILIVAYEKPLMVQEIARALGTPMAFVEESVENLVAAQLMKREGQKVGTDFFIGSWEDELKALAVAKVFARETFDRANPVIMSAVEKYEQIPGFAAFNPIQKYLCAVLSMRLAVDWRVYEAATGLEGQDLEDYPDRPNYGKWIAVGNRYAHNYAGSAELGKYNIGGRANQDEINDYIYYASEYNSAIGPINNANFKYSQTMSERVRLIDAVRTGAVNAFQAELLPDMVRYGFIKEENGEMVPAVPYISQGDDQTFHDIEREAGEAFCHTFLDDLVKMCDDNKVPYPARIPFADEFAYGLPLDYLPMAYVYEAAERGVITIDPDRYYPVMYLVKK